MAKLHKKRKHPSSQKRHTYTNILLAVAGILFAIAISQWEPFTSFLLHLGSYGYLGGFIAGILFVCTPTAALGAVMLSVLIHDVPAIPLCIVAGAGAVAADLVMFHIVKDGLLGELEDIYNQVGGRKLSHIFRSKAFRWTLPVIGAFIIASPLPDELGVGLLGISKLSPLRFALLSWILNSIGIFTAMSAIVMMQRI